LATYTVTGRAIEGFAPVTFGTQSDALRLSNYSLIFALVPVI
jgi:hypothetical protein